MGFIFDFFITVTAYLLVPVIFSVIGYKTNRQYSLSTIRKIVIINGVCVWLIFRIIRLSMGDTGSSGAVFLWSYVAYWIMKRKDDNPTTPYNEVCEEVYEEVYVEDLLSSVQSLAKKARRYKIAIVIVSLLLFLSFGFNAYQVETQSELVNELEYQANVQSELEHELEQSKVNQEKVEFFDEYVVLVEDDDTFLYHKYECSRFKGESFWAFNIDLAIEDGYSPCPICCRK